MPLEAADLPARQITYRTYFDKVYGGWLGKISGLALGVPKVLGAMASVKY
jgi:hypothetical protein